MVTHLTTNLPVRYLNRAKRMGSLVVSRSLAIKTLKITIFSIPLYYSTVNLSKVARCKRGCDVSI